MTVLCKRQDNEDLNDCDDMLCSSVLTAGTNDHTHFICNIIHLS